MTIIQLDDLANPISDVRGNIIHTKQAKDDSTVTYAGKNAIGIVSADPSERQTSILGPHGQPVMEKKYRDGVSHFEQGIDGVVEGFGFTPNENYQKPQEVTAVRVNRSNYSFRDIVDAVHVVAKNIGRFAAAASVVFAPTYVLLGNANIANALPLPTTAVNPTIPWSDDDDDGFAKPADLSSTYITGGLSARGDTSQNLIITDAGWIDIMQGKTEVGSTINSGVAGARGIAYSKSGYLTASQRILYFLDPVTLQQIVDPVTLQPIMIQAQGLLSYINSVATAFGLDSSANVTGLDYAIFFNAGDGIRRLTDTAGHNTLVASGGSWNDLAVIEFKENTYDNPLLRIGGDTYMNLNLNGNTFGDPVLVNMNNSGVGDFVGLMYNGGGMTGVSAGAGLIYTSTFDFATNINSEPYNIPEPTTILLLGLGGLVIGFKRKDKGIFVPEHYHQDMKST